MLGVLRIRYLGYWLIALLLLLVGTLDLATPLLAVLFSYLILSQLGRLGSKWLAIVVFVFLMSGILYGAGFMVRQAVVALPQIAETSVPAILRFANEYGVQLPFEDVQELRSVSIEWARHQLGYVGNFARIATKEFAFLAIGLVVAASLFVNPTLDLDRGKHRLPNNLYSFACEEIVARFRSFYMSFTRVMGAQLVISTLNTGFTAMYIMAVKLPYAVLVIAITFCCGLLPIIGNLISNTVIVAISFTISPKLAIASLTFLVVLHKLEYFLNSKIIGERIKNPVWLTLLALVIGERLMGVPGMILAPVLLNFVKVEASEISLSPTPRGPEPKAPGLEDRPRAAAESPRLVETAR